MDPIVITNREELYGENAKYAGCNLFIEAGAGAGKTETIINLIVAQLFSGVLPEKIVAITFTNKATEELIDRISSILKERIDSKQYGEEQTNILKNALNNIYKMNVSTIHHFCNVILNENCYKANLSFRSILLEEDDEEKRRNSFYYNWIHSLSKNEISEINAASETPFKDLKKTYDSLCNQFDDVKVNSNIQYDFKKFFDLAEELHEKLSNYDSRCYGKACNEFINEFTNVLGYRNAYIDEELYEKYINDKVLKSIRADIKVKGCKAIGFTSEEAEEENEDIKTITSKLKEARDLLLQYKKYQSFNVLNKYAIRAWNEFKERRDRESLCNNQLIYETFKLLNDNPDVKEKIAKQYDIIFVDEFQDTDRYQNQFIMDLAKAIDRRKKEEGKNSTTIVLVGDPKQSIYLFRGADFDLFMHTKNNFDKTGIANTKNIFLPDNYRSNDKVLNWINDTFQKRNFYDGYDYTNMIIPSGNKLPDTSDPKVLAGVYSYNFNKNEQKYDNLAKFIKKLKDGGYKIFGRKNRNSPLEPREIKFSDILVLTTSHSQINNYIVAFNKQNIKTLVAGEFDLCSSPAFNYIYRILLYVFDKENNVKKLFEDSFNSNIYNLNKIEKLNEDIKNFTPYGKLVYVFNNIDLILDSFSESDKILLKTILNQISENICYNEAVSGQEIINEIDKLIHEPAEAQISLDEHDDAVRIMNVHKSKGLTAEIVIFVDSGGFAMENSCKVLGDTIYLNNMSLFPEILTKFSDNKEREKLRLEYVAATRARQLMIFESEYKGKAQLFNRKDQEYDFKDLKNYQLGVELPEIEDNLAEESSKTKRITETGFIKFTKKASEPQYFESSPSALEKESLIKPTIPYLKYNRPANNIFGTCFHRCMELYVLDTMQKVEDIVDRTINENIEDIPYFDVTNYRKYLIACVNATITLYKKEGLLEKYYIHEPEFKFCDFDDSIYGDFPTLMNGSIDLLLKNDDEVLIIDYKTDTNHFQDSSTFENVLKERYLPQIGTYKKVISKLENIDPSKINLAIVWLKEEKDITEAKLLKL